MIDFKIYFMVGLAYAIIPFLIIWSLNTLFGLGIVYEFESWLAMMILVGIPVYIIDLVR